MKTEKKIFPQPVVDKINDFIETIDESDFFKDHEISGEYAEEGKILIHNHVGDYFLSKFLLNENLMFTSYNEIEDLLKIVIVECCMMSLMDKNVVEGVENENGEMLYWLKKNK